MMRALFKACFFVTCFALAIQTAQAQTKVHAVSGTVTSINPKIEMIEITTDDGSSAHFRWLKKSDGAIDFDKTVSADTVPVEKFTTKGTHVIVYYFGEGDVRTAVALRDLGDGSLEKSIGTVVKLNRHERVLIIKNSSGAEESFHVDPRTVADTATGVVEGFKSDFSKGDQVRVTAAQTNGSATALLIVPAL
jgi:hypothetical protein